MPTRTKEHNAKIAEGVKANWAERRAAIDALANARTLLTVLLCKSAAFVEAAARRGDEDAQELARELDEAWTTLAAENIAGADFLHSNGGRR